MEAIIINENLEKQNDEIRKINSFCSKLNALLPEFKLETGYELDRDDLTTLMQSGSLDELIDKVNQHMESQMQGVNFSGLIRKTFTSNTKEFIYGFSEKLKRFYSLNYSEHLHSLSMENGSLFLSKENEEEIRSGFVNMITSEKGKQLFEVATKTAESLTELVQFVKSNTNIHHTHIHIQALTGDFFFIDPETGVVQLSKLMSYDRLIKK